MKCVDCDKEIDLDNDYKIGVNKNGDIVFICIDCLKNYDYFGKRCDE